MHPETRNLTGRLKKHQVEALEKISREEKNERSTALRKLLDIGIGEYAKNKAIEEYRKGKMSVGRAAKEARVSIAEFFNLIADEGIAIRIDSKHLKNALKSDIASKMI